MAQAFCAWLLRPYLDLGAYERGPLHVQRVEECWDSFSNPDAPYFVAQRSLVPAFRAELAREAGRPECAAGDPRALPAEARTDRWRELCEACDQYGDLPPDRQARLAALLHALCLYDVVLNIAPAGIPVHNPAAAEVAFWRAFAQYMTRLPDHPLSGADLSQFEALALGAGSGASRFNAAIRVFVEKAKTGDRRGDLAIWGGHLERALADCLSGRSAFERELLQSRFYRALGFIPQRQGDRSGTVRMMDQAERHAMAVPPSTSAERILHLENLHALMESRAKEAIWLGDLDLAMLRARRVTEVDPFDSKAWTELGQVRMKRREWLPAAEAYAVAAILGPPASAIARYMAGTCLQHLGQPMLSALLFKDTLEIDPLSISAREALDHLPVDGLRKAVGEWMARTVEL